MKAWRALRPERRRAPRCWSRAGLTQMLVTPRPERLGYIRYAFERGMSVREVARFNEDGPVVPAPGARGDAGEMAISETTPEEISTEQLRQLKRWAERRADCEEWKLEGHEGIKQVRQLREGKGIKPVFKLVDHCAAEFESMTPYLYSTYDEEDEAPPTDKPKVIILGSGPNRIGRESSSITAAATRPLR